MRYYSVQLDEDQLLVVELLYVVVFVFYGYDNNFVQFYEIIREVFEENL
jgi:hypothetical protein